MNPMYSGLALSGLSVVIGWAAMWPLRKQLGAHFYHLSALPVGMLSWTLVAAFTSLTGRPFDVASLAIGAILYVAAVSIIGFLAAGPAREADCSVQWWSYVAMAMAVAFVGGVAAVGRFTIASGDSWGAFWPQAVLLERFGGLTVGIVADRGPVLTSYAATNIVFGGDWVFIIYALTAVDLLALLVSLLLDAPGWHGGRVARIAVPACAVAILVTNSTFLYNSFYVHSHMVSALFLLLSLGALSKAVDLQTGEPVASARAWLVVSGVSAAGLALARPDGLAYLAVPVLLAVSILSDRAWDAKRSAAFFVPLLLITYTFFLAAFAKIGIWTVSEKLAGSTALIILIGLAFVPFLPVAIRALDERLPFRVGGQALLVIALVVGAVVLSVADAVFRARAIVGLANAGTNLFLGDGAWGYFWYVALVMLGLTVVSGDAWRPKTLSRSLFATIVLFFMVAALIHTILHTGRIGVGDSLNRIVFHIVPVIIWYLGIVVGRILGQMRTVAPGELETTR
jgi:hypothetical protein